MSAYYNEFDKEKAAWLRELIKAGLIAPGEVDERSIEDVNATDLVGYRQCHFFGGIGVWSYALRLAGWPDQRPVWTGSCPCPSFSAAGKGAGFDDPRHLWPHWARLIRECKPPVVFGEQVDDAIGFGWLDLVQTDLEAEAYAVGKAVLGACSVGAPHIRQRLYFVALGDAERGGRHRWTLDAQRGPEGRTARGTGRIRGTYRGKRRSLHLGLAGGEGLPDSEPQELRGTWRGREGRAVTESGEAPCELGQPESLRRNEDVTGDGCGQEGQGRSLWAKPDRSGAMGRPGPVNGFWRDADWIRCRDAQWRPVRPGSLPLVTGASARVVRLRGYGDGITTQTAQAFIESVMEVID